MTRVMVDMSFTLIHHGHIRLLKKAKDHGDVVVALTTDDISELSVIIAFVKKLLFLLEKTW